MAEQLAEAQDALLRHSPFTLLRYHPVHDTM